MCEHVACIKHEAVAAVAEKHCLKKAKQVMVAENEEQFMLLWVQQQVEVHMEHLAKHNKTILVAYKV